MRVEKKISSGDWGNATIIAKIFISKVQIVCNALTNMVILGAQIADRGKIARFA